MTTDLILLTVGVLLVCIILALLYLRRGRRRRVEAENPAEIHARMAGITDARIDAGERQASLISEQIEEMVKQELASYPDLANSSIDFGTAEDGSLEIWFEGARYYEVNDVPDERVRQAVKKAVSTFNQ